MNAMKVILVEKVQGLGEKGDVVTVKDGYARNFLIPRGKVMPANEGNLARLDAKIRREQIQVKKDTREAEQLAERLKSVSCTIRVQADEGDKLYGSVGPREIAQALEDQGIHLDVGTVEMEEHIKMLGVYPVKVVLLKGIEAEIKVWIIRE